MKSLFHKSKPQNTRSLLGSSSKLQSYMPIIQPLSQDFFGDLMKLENMFYRSKYTVETLDNLVQLYAKAVEYYDGIRDGISTYFMFKIQDILATKQSLKMLIDRKDETTTENGSTQSEKAKTYSESFSNGLPQGQIINFIKQDYFTEQNSALKAASGKTENQAFECIRSQRQKLFQFNQRFEAEVATAKRCIQELFEEFKETAVQLDEVVLNNVNQQKQRLYKKLERKRNQDLISYAMNESSNSLLSFQSLIDNNGRKEYAINILQAELSEEENLADKKEIVRDDQNLQIKVKPNLLSHGGFSVDQSSAESSFTITETNNSDKTEK